MYEYDGKNLKKIGSLLDNDLITVSKSKREHTFLN